MRGAARYRRWFAASLPLIRPNHAWTCYVVPARASEQLAFNYSTGYFTLLFYSLRERFTQISQFAKPSSLSAEGMLHVTKHMMFASFVVSDRRFRLSTADYIFSNLSSGG